MCGLRNHWIIKLHHAFPFIELVQRASKDDSRDFLFYLAVANYRLKVRLYSLTEHFKSYINWTAAPFFFTFSFLFPSKDYERALKYIRTLLKNEPGNKQALELEQLIDKALKKGKNPSGWCTSLLWERTITEGLLTLTCPFPDGLVGMAIVGGLGLSMAAVAGLIGLAVSKGASKS